MNAICRVRIAVSVAALAVMANSQAQYPVRPVKLLVAVAPGGAPDVVARTFADRLGPLLGQNVVVENRAGANGNIAMELVSKSAPDGYTLLLGQDSLIVVNPHMYSNMPLNPLKDLTPVGSLAASSAFLLVVPSSLPVKNFQEFIDYARVTKPPLSYASGGNGSLHHLAMEMLKLRSGIDLLHVPYKSGAAAVTAVLGGEVSAAITSTVTGSHVRAGRLRALALTGERRSPAFGDLPAVAEFYPGYQMFSWFGLFAPTGVPDAALARLRTEISAALESIEVRQRLQAAGQFEPYVTSREEFSARIRGDYEKFGALVKQLAIRVD